jgi:hypothetical protein
MNRLIILIPFLLLSNAAYAEEGVDCWYCARRTETNPNPEIERHENCTVIIKGEPIFKKEHLNRISFDDHDLASTLIGDQHYYIRANGRMLPVVTFDNWADDFSEGLTRSLVNGKIAYYDRHFNQVIGPKYDWGWPFENGRALVCKGCKIQPPDEYGHTPVTGGFWGYINQKGEEIVPVRFSRREALGM